ncbi:MAG: NADH:ubiquinone reductase (Na(+)-transporting) subunit C [Saprospiraceae bacterium]
MESTNYVVGFTLAMTVLVALTLSSLFYGTKDQVAQNADVFNKRAILSAISDKLDRPVGDFSDQDVLTLFEEKVEQKVLDMNGDEIDGIMAEKVDIAKEAKKLEADRQLPLFIYNAGGEKVYIVAVRGSGLWDAIWGNIALQSDFTTVVGASFDHAGETPGLGAEIKDNPAFAKQFGGKKIYKNGDYVSVGVIKGGAKDIAHDVDGLSGATVTANGVDEMLYRGIKYYEPYFGKVKG